MVRLIIRHFEIGREFPEGMRLSLKDDAFIVDVLKVADQLLIEKSGEFPVRGFSSLLQMV